MHFKIFPHINPERPGRVQIYGKMKWWHRWQAIPDQIYADPKWAAWTIKKWQEKERD
jgi:hypothetical protein